MSKVVRSELNILFCRIWLIFGVILIVIISANGIRVYEGTNFPAPPKKIQKTVGIKKSLYISKRSWSSGEENGKTSIKADRRLEGKWKDFNKKTMTDDTPSLYKVKFTEKKLIQYMKYIKEIPRLEEYTFCVWYKSNNLTHDQTIFLYSLSRNEALVRFWINAIDSTLRVAIRETIVYKVPANIREGKWHHFCQSWNGVLGEMQIFLDGKRIGATIISHYKGTYIPEGGEVTLGQEMMVLGKRLDDGMDGEMFGFNLVDESVPHDQGNFINSQYRPNVVAIVPPFKKLPPIKKTYQEIKAYISTLPSDPVEARNKEPVIVVEEPNTIKKPKPSRTVPPKRSRGNSRIRYPPLRKVVVYNRDDRQLPLEEEQLELNKTNPITVEKIKPIEKIKNKTAELETYDENYSIHSYKQGKKENKSTNYEIYEAIEDDEDRPAAGEEEGLTKEELLQRKARQNFNLFTARQANKIYTLSSSVKDFKKPKFHFESQPEASNRRSFEIEESKPTEAKKALEQSAERRISDSIPVYETDGAEVRRKRNADAERESRQLPESHPLVDANGFRRLPDIPETFINLFSKNTSKSEMAEQLEEFFSKNRPKEESSEEEKISTESVIYLAVTELPTTAPKITTNVQSSEELKVTGSFIPTVIPEFSPMPTTGKTLKIKQTEPATVLTNPIPLNFPVDVDQVEELEVRRPVVNRVTVPNRYAKINEKQDNVFEKRFDVSSGTDLVMRSYGECTADRGSPVTSKHHLVISWADTPVRIFGGAQIEGARNECGNF